MRKKYILLAVVTCALVAIVVTLQRQPVYASTVHSAAEGQPLYIHLDRALSAKSLKNDVLYITNKDGEQIRGNIALSESKDMITVVGLSKGSYTLHIKKEAFTILSKGKKELKIPFSIVERVEKITSTKDLQTYFRAAFNNDNGRRLYAREDMVTAESEDSAAKNEASPGDYSTTNNQVEGIEEGDIVVTDGRYIYALLDNKLVVTDAKDAKNMQVIATKAFQENEYATKLMLYKGVLIVAYEGYDEKKITGKDYTQATYYTKFKFYDVKDPKNMQLVREIGQEGTAAGIRQYGDTLYIVTNSSPNYWLMQEGIDVELRPVMYDSSKQNTSEPLPVEKISILPHSQEPNYTTITTLNLTNYEKGSMTTQSYLGSGATLYMSQKAIYVTAPKFEYTTPATENEVLVDRLMLPASQNTNVYKFAIDKTAVQLVAQNEVKGMLLNQFSMDEYNGNLRIATTEGFAWGKNADSKNHLFILDSKLQQIGALTDLARGERIYSVRFMGEKAYIVTFKEVDPLFVIDVANPRQPKVLGELKIPGFSNYLHPLGENHLIGIGYDTEVRMDSYSKEPFIVTKGMKLALFDVTDLANPKEQDAVIIGGRGTYSAVQYDHKALMRNVEKGYYGFPVTIYDENGKGEMRYLGTGAQVYEVTTKGITLKGDLIDKAQANEQYEQWEKAVQRIIYIDDAVYTISSEEIKSYNIDSFRQLDEVKITAKRP